MNSNLIDTYVSEIGRRLPEESRSDIEAEIRSILQDMLDERSKMTANRQIKKMIVEVLKNMGHQKKLPEPYPWEIVT